MIQLEVNGLLLDLFGEEVITVSKAIGKVGDITNRNGDLSTDFKIPINTRNTSILGDLTVLSGFKSFSAFKRYDGRVLNEGIEISKGYFQVLSYNRQEAEIELRFLGGNSDWFDRISNLEITDLDYSDINHLWTKENIIASFNNTQDYFYAPCDNGKNSKNNTNEVTLEDFVIGVFVVTILKKIFLNAGLQIGGTLLNDGTLLNSLVTGQINRQVGDIPDATKFFTTSERQVLPNVSQAPVPIYFNTGNSGPQWNGSTWTAAAVYSDVLIDIREYLEMSINFGVDLELTAQATLNGVVQPPDVRIIPRQLIQAVGNGRAVYQCEEVFLYSGIVAGDTIAFTHRVPGPTTTQNADMLTGFNGDNSQVSINTLGGKPLVDLAEVLPKINQADFVRDIMFRHGFVCTYEPNNETVVFNKFNEIDGNKIRAVDLSNKIDLSTPPEVDFTTVLSGYSKTSTIAYKDDENDTDLQVWKAVNKLGFGSGRFTIDSDFLTGDKVIYESVFAATAQRLTWAYTVGDATTAQWLLPHVPYFKQTNTPGEFEDQEVTPRIMLRAGNIDVTDFNRAAYAELIIRDKPGDPATNVSTCGYMFFAKPVTSGIMDTSGLDNNNQTLAIQTPDPNYKGLTLLQNNFEVYRRILNKPIALDINLNLSPTEVKNVNFLIPIYLGFSLDNGYYYIDEISQYKGEGSTTIKLIKL